MVVVFMPRRCHTFFVSNFSRNIIHLYHVACVHEILHKAIQTQIRFIVTVLYIYEIEVGAPSHITV